jgi:hypothetical protein
MGLYDTPRGTRLPSGWLKSLMHFNRPFWRLLAIKSLKAGCCPLTNAGWPETKLPKNAAAPKDQKTRDRQRKLQNVEAARPNIFSAQTPEKMLCGSIFFAIFIINNNLLAE